jgi:bile acid-coenzyme A ligase
MPGPLYHNGPLMCSWQALLWDSQVVILPRFNSQATLAAVARHHADVMYLVPTMMKRIIRLPDEVRNAYDVSSLRAVWHMAEPCPEWLKQRWIDWLGAEKIFEVCGYRGDLGHRHQRYGMARAPRLGGQAIHG